MHRTYSSSVGSAPPNTFSSKSNSTSHLNSNPKSSVLWTPSLPSWKEPSRPVSRNGSSPTALLADTTSWPHYNLSKRDTTQNNIVFHLWMARIVASILGRFSFRKDRGLRLVNRLRSASSDRSRLGLRWCTRIFFTLVTTMFVPSTPRILVSSPNCIARLCDH